MTLVIQESEEFSRWVRELRDRTARGIILGRIQRLTSGNPGDVKPVGNGISELRIRFGPGYRVYFLRRGKELILLLCGGDKSSQAADIRNAKEIAAALKEG